MEKKYYSIREVSEKIGEPQSTLRFWEKEINLLNPGKSPGGTRRYVQSDIDLLLQIKFLIDEQHLTLDGVNERLTKHRSTDEKRMKIIQTLKSVRKELMAIRKELNVHEALAEEVIIDWQTHTQQHTSSEDNHTFNNTNDYEKSIIFIHYSRSIGWLYQSIC